MSARDIQATIDQLAAAAREAAAADLADAEAYRALRALAEGGRLLDRARLIQRIDAVSASKGHPVPDYPEDIAALATETALALAAGMLSDEAIDAAARAYWNAPTTGLGFASLTHTRMGAGMRAALALVFGPSFQVPALRTQSCPRCDMHAEQEKTERARADREKARADKAERDYAACRAAFADANLADADLTAIRDDLFRVLDAAPKEVRGLVRALRTGRVDGSVYEGECACLVGTIAKVRGCAYTAIPGLTPDGGRAAERWFLAIRPGRCAGDPVVDITLGWIAKWIDREVRAGRRKPTRLLTHDEAKRKAVAEALRAFGDWCRTRGGALDFGADEAERRADALWPRKGARS